MQKIALATLFAAFTHAHAAESITFTPPYGHGYPEGIAWHPGQNAFLVSSLRGGSIGLVAADGSYRVFAADKRLLTSAGIVVDEARNRVLVSNSDVGVAHGSSSKTLQRTAQVFEFDLDSGALRHIYDFSALAQGATLANDLTIDPQGNLYVTDSFQPHIYRAQYADKAVSILIRDERLRPQSDGETTGLLPNLNGIVHHPQGYLLASDYVRGKLWRIPLDQPAALREVQLPERLKGPDGLRLQADGTLAAVQTAVDAGGNMQSEVAFLQSDNGWQSARVIRSVALPDVDGATTATVKNGELWIVNSHFPALFAAPDKADDARQTFELLRVE
ncbi:MAG: SMP-30/gluconolactonase/LRE family protein [Cardiobacteriaceae bacterium]|nr:SMP-30/gluconolactonase/LRE family protein [Cardiobacteriaceae bacterium]